MPRPFGQKFLLELNSLTKDPLHPGIRLGRLCVSANIPAKYVANALNVSAITVYAWFRGDTVRDPKHVEELDKLSTRLENDWADKMSSGVFPFKKLADAKKYLETGREEYPLSADIIIDTTESRAYDGDSSYPSAQEMIE